MKRILTPLILGCCLLAAAPLLPAQAQERQSLSVNRIVAVVNDDVIVQSDLDARVRVISDQLRQQGTVPPRRDVLERQVLERLVVERIQLQLAARTGIRVDDDSLNQVIANLARQNELSLVEFRDILEADGYDFAQFREEIRNELIITRLRQRQVDSQVEITEQEIDHFLATMDTQRGGDREYRLSHILIPVPEAASPEHIQRARAEGERVLAELRRGADFATTAISVSGGQQALSGGDLGWRSAGQLPTLFADLVPAMRPGEVSELIRSPSGFHIIQLADVRTSSERHVVTQTQARHILIRPTALVGDDEARRRLWDVKERVEQGADFGELASSHSDDRASAADGGALGWVRAGQLVPEFEEEMNRLAPGAISEPFRTPFGWHIVQVLDRREVDDTKEFRREQAREVIRNRKVDEEHQEWLRRLRDEAYVDYRLDARP